MEKRELKALIEKIDGKMVAIASDETVDRSGESVPISKWQLKNFKKNPVLQFGHNYNIPPVGVAKNIRVDGKKLLFEPVFHSITQFAREIGQMYDEGIMKAFSVGFIPGEEGNELIEISAVPVPANPEALVLAKSMEQSVDKSIEVEAWLQTLGEKGVEIDVVVAEKSVDEIVAEIPEDKRKEVFETLSKQFGDEIGSAGETKETPQPGRLPSQSPQAKEARALQLALKQIVKQSNHILMGMNEKETQ